MTVQQMINKINENPINILNEFNKFEKKNYISIEKLRIFFYTEKSKVTKKTLIADYEKLNRSKKFQEYKVNFYKENFKKVFNMLKNYYDGNEECLISLFEDYNFNDEISKIKFSSELRSMDWDDLKWRYDVEDWQLGINSDYIFTMQEFNIIYDILISDKDLIETYEIETNERYLEMSEYDEFENEEEYEESLVS